MSLATSDLTPERREDAAELLAFSRSFDTPEQRLERELAERSADFVSVEGRRVA